MADSKNLYTELNKEQRKDIRKNMIPRANSESVYAIVSDPGIRVEEKLGFLEYAQGRLDSEGMRAAAAKYLTALKTPQDGRSNDFDTRVETIRQETKNFDKPPPPKKPLAERYPRVTRATQRTGFGSLAFLAVAAFAYIGKITYTKIVTSDAERLERVKKDFAQKCDVEELSDNPNAFLIRTPDGTEYEVRISNEKQSHYQQEGPLEIKNTKTGETYELNEKYFSEEDTGSKNRSDFGSKPQIECYGPKAQGTAAPTLLDHPMTGEIDGATWLAAPVIDTTQPIVFKVVPRPGVDSATQQHELSATV